MRMRSASGFLATLLLLIASEVVAQKPATQQRGYLSFELREGVECASASYSVRWKKDALRPEEEPPCVSRAAVIDERDVESVELYSEPRQRFVSRDSTWVAESMPTAFGLKLGLKAHGSRRLRDITARMLMGPRPAHAAFVVLVDGVAAFQVVVADVLDRQVQFASDNVTSEEANNWVESLKHQAKSPLQLEDAYPLIQCDRRDAGELSAIDIQVITRKAESGYSEAECLLAVAYREGASVPKDLNRAVAMLRRLAASGHAVAQNLLGDAYAEGEGVGKNEAEAVRWYRRAADQGLADAQDNLGMMYEWPGRGVNADDAEAVRWFTLAANQGYKWGQYHLGLMYLRAQGVERDMERAANLVRKAAEQGLRSAQEEMGSMYRYGNGVRHNYEEALRWFRKAAERDDPVAQVDLAEMYAEGNGVEPDMTQSIEWLMKAAKQRFSPAEFRLARRYETGEGVARDVHQAVEWYRKAGEDGFDSAYRELARIYEEGRGVAKDRNEAIKYLRILADKDDPGAVQMLKTLGVEYQPVQKK